MTWNLLGNEGDRVTVPDGSTVRYGESVDGRHVERVLSGAFTISNGTFGGDPAPNVRKSAWLPVSAQAPQPPAPQPPEAAPPSMPTLGDPQFDQKAAIFFAWQRAESIKATLTLAESQAKAARAYEEGVRAVTAAIAAVGQG
jgi:hypothetical protein